VGVLVRVDVRDAYTGGLNTRDLRMSFVRDVSRLDATAEHSEMEVEQ
jgi:hypothetical protein